MREGKISNFSPLRTAVFISIFLLFTPFIAPAEIPSLPANVNPNVVGQEFLPSQKFPSAMASPTSMPEEPSALSSKAAEQIRFKLNKITVMGNTVYSSQELENLFKSSIGQTISVAKLQQMANIITTKYRTEGYILSKAILPPQVIKNGHVTIQVVEGYIQNVSIQGNAGRAHTLLTAYGKHIQQNDPLQLQTLERYSLLANDIPGGISKTVLTPSAIAQKPGAADIKFVTTQKPVDGYLSFDNRGTKYLGPNEYTLGVATNSGLMSGDRIGIQLLNTTKTNQLKYGRAYYHAPLNSDGLALDITTTYVHTNPGYLLQNLNVVGISRSASAILSYPLLLRQNQNLYINGGFDALNSQNNIYLTTPPLELYEDHLRSARLGVSFSMADAWQGINQISTQYSQGLLIFGASRNNASDLSRSNGRSDYKKITLEASRIQNLGHQFSLLAGMKSQYAFNPLLVEEQFYFGGATFGRAYDPAEISGDSGLAGRVELRYDTEPTYRFLQHIQYYTSYDIGKVWNINYPNAFFPDDSAASAAAGIRTTFNRYLSGSLELAKPLTEKVSTYNNKSPRLFFSLTAAL